MANEPTIELTLPSKGLLYPDNPELAGKIVLRAMTTDDEKVVFGSQGDRMTTNLLKRCLVSPQFDPDDLVLGDRQYLFMQLRIFTYGDEYHIKWECPADRSHKGEKKISLTEDLIVHELPDDFDPNPIVKLPRSGSEVGLRFLTVKQLDRIAKRASNFAKKTGQKVGDVEFLYRKAEQIVTIDGKEIDWAEKEKFIKILPALDSAKIESVIGSGLKLGYDYLVSMTCPECGEEFETVFTASSEFFRPRFD